MTGAPILEVRGMELHYGRVQVLFGVDLTVDAGDWVALLGTNGAGKSTVLKAVSSLVPLSAGRVYFDGDDVTGMEPDRLVALGLGHVPGGRGLLADLSVEENLRLGGHLLGRQALDEAFERVLALFPWMANRRRQLAGTLSGGEQQMIALGRALMTSPRLLMIDELSLGLAPVIVDELMGVLHGIHDAGTTLVIVEQQVSLALRHAHRAFFLEKGRVRFSGPSAELEGRDDLLRSVFLGA